MTELSYDKEVVLTAPVCVAQDPTATSGWPSLVGGDPQRLQLRGQAAIRICGAAFLRPPKLPMHAWVLVFEPKITWLWFSAGSTPLPASDLP